MHFFRLIIWYYAADVLSDKLSSATRPLRYDNYVNVNGSEVFLEADTTSLLNKHFRADLSNTIGWGIGMGDIGGLLKISIGIGYC